MASALFTWSKVVAIAGTEAVGAGPNGAEVLVIDGEGYLNQPESHTSMGVGTTGLAGNLPARPVGFLIMRIGANQFKVPYYNM